MTYERCFKNNGETIVLGATDYTVTGIEGFGGSSVVYRASYRDELNREKKHNVFIKELFPYTRDGGIYRNNAGNICCDAENAALMEQHKKGFYRGNNINLELLERYPEQVSGSINSYEKYGTYYSVLTVHGGENFEHIIDSAKKTFSLLELCNFILKILDSLEVFHKNGILHLDISPDNVLMLPESSFLIDYNSVWCIGDEDKSKFSFSVKEGYSAPEVRLKEFSEINFSTDLYSVCAVFFRLVTGHPLSDKEVVGNGLAKSFPKNLSVFRDEPITAVRKCVEIICKGLHTLPEKRFESISAIRNEINEVVRRIEGKGITHSSLWESSRLKYKKYAAKDKGYIEQEILTRGERYTKQDIFAMLRNSDAILLQGAGGMGKTRLLCRLWADGLSSYNPNMPVPIYISLADYQRFSGSSDYIFRQILKELNFNRDIKTTDTAFNTLERLLSNEAVQLILLLDGLNEAGGSRVKLIKEIEVLGTKSGVGVLVTERSDEVKKYGLSGFAAAELLPLSEAAVKAELEKSKIRFPNDAALAAMLSNPMMLTLYINSVFMNRECGTADGDNTIANADSMVGVYLDSLLSSELRLYSGDRKMQLSSGIIINHLLPAIAAKMKEKSLLSLSELHSVSVRSFRQIQGEAFGKAFREYMGISRLVLSDKRSSEEWFDFAVREQLIEKLNLLSESSEGYYRLIHDDFKGYLTARHRQNVKKLLNASKKNILLFGGVLVLLITALSVGGVYFYRHPVGKTVLSAQEKRTITNATYILIDNLSSLNTLIEKQETILELASEDDVVNGETAATVRLSERIDKTLAETERIIATTANTKEYTDEVSDVYSDVLANTLSDLYGAPFELDGQMRKALLYLQKKLCSPDDYRPGAGNRKKLIEVYYDYLDKYKRVIYCQLDILLYEWDASNSNELKETFRYLSAFRDYTRNINKEDFESNLTRAKDSLYAAKAKMNQEGYFE